MPAPHPPEFRRRAVELALLKDKPVAEIAKDIGISESCLLASMGRVASSVDNTMIESFWSTMQRELLDTRRRRTKDELASAIFEWIEAWYNRRRRHTSLGMLSPVEFEALHTKAASAA